jgi:hypothetical protein
VHLGMATVGQVLGTLVAFDRTAHGSYCEIIVEPLFWVILGDFFIRANSTVRLRLQSKRQDQARVTLGQAHAFKRKTLVIKWMVGFAFR